MPRPEEVGPLEFGFAELFLEVQSLSRIANDYFTPESVIILDQTMRSLEHFRDYSDNTAVTWAVSADAPIRTITSMGEYERNDGGSHKVFAEISWIWEILPLGPHGRKHRASRTFALCGKASSVIRFFEEQKAGKVELAMWRMEVADSEAPGCFFHVQVLGAHASPPFPNSLPIPRLPSLVFTPMLAIEYTLAELFLERWRREVAQDSYDLQQWRTIQRDRLIKLWRWHSRVIAAGTGTPVALYKEMKPPKGLFLAE